MNYALNLAEDGRILSAAYAEAPLLDVAIVDELPEGNVADYRFVNGELIHDPLPVAEVEEQPTQLDRIEAQVTYTALMTDTLLEV